jgi:hypothetical protein
MKYKYCQFHAVDGIVSSAQKFPAFCETGVSICVKYSPLLGLVLVYLFSCLVIYGLFTDAVSSSRGVGFRVPVGEFFSLLHVVQTGSGSYPASYPIGTGGSFPRGKAAGA